MSREAIPGISLAVTTGLIVGLNVFVLFRNARVSSVIGGIAAMTAKR